MTSRHLYALVLLLFGYPLNAQPATRPRGPIDSVVLVRTPAWRLPCPTCPPAHIVLRRGASDSTALAAFSRKADSLGFYALPANVMGASFCQVVRSDDLLATLSIYHPDGHWSVRGYHHCRDRSPEQAGLLALESLVDSLAVQPRRPPY